MALAASGLRAAPDEREVRTAMVGIGHRGTTLLGQVMKQERVRVTAICDADGVEKNQSKNTACDAFIDVEFAHQTHEGISPTLGGSICRDKEDAHANGDQTSSGQRGNACQPTQRGD